MRKIKRYLPEPARRALQGAGSKSGSRSRALAKLKAATGKDSKVSPYDVAADLMAQAPGRPTRRAR